MTVCDQKQESTFVCLRSAGATRDCTLCDMVSKVTKAEQQRQREQNVHHTVDDWGIYRSDSHDSLDTAVQGEDVDLDSLKTQLSPQGGCSRNVVRALGAKIVLGISKVQKGGVGNGNIITKMQCDM